MANDDPATVEMFEQPIIGALVALCFVLSMNLYPLTMALGWQAITKQKFCSRIRNHRWREKQLCSKISCSGYAKTTIIACCALCFTTSVTI
jgi:hypothetical protein